MRVYDRQTHAGHQFSLVYDDDGELSWFVIGTTHLTPSEFEELMFYFYEPAPEETEDGSQSG